MPNLNQILRDEITRLARRQITPVTRKVHKSTAQLKHDVAALKRTVKALERQNRLLQDVVDRIAKTHPLQAPEAAARTRLTGKGFRSLRRKLKLTQDDFGRLIGVTAQTVLKMERKNGPLAMRKATRAAILAIRGMGAREAKARVG